jgi:solute:Na+ symporter, SSS family
MLSTIDYILIAVYFLTALVVGIMTGRKREREDYLIANRELNAFQTASTIFASRIGAAILLTYTALVFLHGLAALWYFIGAVFGLFVFYYFGKKIKKLGDQHKFYTLPDFFFFSKGKFAGYLSTLIVVIIMFGWVVLNFIAGGKLVAEYTPISYELSVVLVAGVILTYMIVGGFRAVVMTDIIQSVGIFLLIILMIFLLIASPVKPKIVFTDLFSIQVKEIVSFFLAGFFIPMASPELWQRVYAVKDEKHFRRSLFLSSVFYVIIGLILMGIGLIIRVELPNIEAGTSLIVGFSKLLPVGLAGLSVVIVYSAVSSSADTYMFTSAASVTQDFLQKSGLLPEKNLFIAMRICLVILMIMGVTMAFVLKDIIDTTFFFVSLTMALGFLVLVIWIYPNLNKYSVNYTIVFCLIGVVVPAIVIGISTTLIIYAWGLCIVGLLAGIVVNYFMKPSKVKEK